VILNLHFKVRKPAPLKCDYIWKYNVNFEGRELQFEDFIFAFHLVILSIYFRLTTKVTISFLAFCYALFASPNVKIAHNFSFN
jgi:hypothetical protein